MECFYTFEKHSDGIYTIYAVEEQHKEIVEMGVRGCNVRKRIGSLYAKRGMCK